MADDLFIAARPTTTHPTTTTPQQHVKPPTASTSHINGHSSTEPPSPSPTQAMNNNKRSTNARPRVISFEYTLPKGWRQSEELFPETIINYRELRREQLKRQGLDDSDSDNDDDEEGALEEDPSISAFGRSKVQESALAIERKYVINAFVDFFVSNVFLSNHRG